MPLERVDQSDATPGGFFPPTRWTVVRQLSNGEWRVRFPAWQDFVEAYRRPLEIWLHSRCRDPHFAEEMVQSFFAKMSQREHNLAALKPENGKLRSWLLICLKRHWLDHLPQDKAIESIEQKEGACEIEDEDFDGAWARSLAQRVVDQLRQEYRRRDRGKLFDSLLAMIDGANIEERAALQEKLQMSRNNFDKALERLRDRLATRLRLEVAATLVDCQEDDELVDEELRHLVRVLARNGGFPIAQATDGHS